MRSPSGSISSSSSGATTISLGAGGGRQPGAAQRLVDAGGDRVEGDDAGLHRRRAEPGVELPAAARQRRQPAGEAELADRRDVEELRERARLGLGRGDVEGEGVEVADLAELDHAGEFGIVGRVGDELGHHASFGPAPCRAGPSSLNLDHAGSRGAREFGSSRGKPCAEKRCALPGLRSSSAACSRPAARPRCRCTATFRRRPTWRGSARASTTRAASRRSSGGRRRAACWAIRPGTTCRAWWRATPTTRRGWSTAPCSPSISTRAAWCATSRRYGLEHGRVIDLETRTTETGGRELGVLEQLFGNLLNLDAEQLNN